MSCFCGSKPTFTCSNASFSQPLSQGQIYTAPGIPAHYFNLYCPVPATTLCYTTSANHAISCNAYNGYQPLTCVTLPGHSPSCPLPGPCPCPCGTPKPINCHNN